MLFSGTTRQIKDCVKERIDIGAKDGGYIVDLDLWFDEARSEKRENNGRIHQRVGCAL